MITALRVTAIGLALAMATLGGCASRTPPSETRQNSSLPVAVSIVPQEYFVKRIGGDKVIVNALIGPGVDPHTYEPKPEQLERLSNAKAYFKIGVSLEDAWKDRLASVNDRLLLVDTSQGVPKIPLTEEHDHDGEKESHGAKTDQHIWLSPKRVKVQAETIYKTLARLDPANGGFYKANFDRFARDLDALDTEIRATLSGVKNRRFMVFHPEWGYFARDYGLEMVAIQSEGNEPSAAELARLIAEAKKEDIKVIFTQPEFSRKSSDTIAREIGGRVIPISAFNENWSENLRSVARTMAAELNN